MIIFRLKIGHPDIIDTEERDYYELKSIEADIGRVLDEAPVGSICTIEICDVPED